MSTSLHIYVGPYLKCKVGVVESTATVRACTNPGCLHEGISKTSDVTFCGRCGHPLGDFAKVDRHSAVHWYDASQAIKEALHCHDDNEGGDHFWFPNVRRDPPRAFNVEGETRHDVNDSDIDDELEWFLRAFGDEVEILGGLYGTEQVNRRWGVVAYYW